MQLSLDILFVGRETCALDVCITFYALREELREVNTGHGLYGLQKAIRLE